MAAYFCLFSVRYGVMAILRVTVVNVYLEEKWVEYLDY